VPQVIRSENLCIFDRLGSVESLFPSTYDNFCQVFSAHANFCKKFELLRDSMIGENLEERPNPSLKIL
jgi:hypothetical protein